MESTPMGCADDLLRFFGIFTNDPESRSVNIFVERLDFDPNSIKDSFYQPKLQLGSHMRSTSALVKCLQATWHDRNWMVRRVFLATLFETSC